MHVRERDKSHERRGQPAPRSDADLRAARLRIQQRLADWRGELHERVGEIDTQVERAEIAALPITQTHEAVPAPSRRVERRGLRRRVEEAPAIAIAIPAGALLSGAVAAAYVWLAVSDGGFDPSAYTAAGLFVWWAAVLALLLRIWPRGGLPPATAGAGALLAAFSILALLSTTWAGDGGRAFVEAVRALGYLGVFVLAAIVVRAGGARDLLGGIAIGLTVLAGLALLSRLQPGLVGSEAELQRLLPETAGRLSYPIGYWNGLAACMALLICLLTWLGADARSRTGRALAVAALPIPPLVIYFTGSRGGGIAAFVGLVALLALAPQRWRTLAVIALGTAGAVVLMVLANGAQDLVRGLDTSGAEAAGDRLTIAVVAVSAIFALLAFRGDGFLERLRPERFGIPSPIAATIVVIAVLVANNAVQPGEQLQEQRATEQISSRVQPVDDQQVPTSTTSGRIEYWQTAVDGFETAPIVGLGAGEFETWWTLHGELSQPVSNAHSLFIETLTELGLLGALLLVGFIAVAAISGFRRTLAARRLDARDAGVGVGAAALALLAAGVVSAAGEWTWELPAAFAPVVVAAAVLTTPAAGDARRRRTPGGPVRLGLVLLLAAGAIVATGLVYLSELRLDQSRVAVSADDLELAAERAQSASDLQPWDAEPYTQLALIERSRGHPEAAKTAVGEAIERAPEDWRLWFLLAHIEYRLGNYQAERAALARARVLAPRAPASLFVAPGPRTPVAPPAPGVEQ